MAIDELVNDIFVGKTELKLDGGLLVGRANSALEYYRAKDEQHESEEWAALAEYLGGEENALYRELRNFYGLYSPDMMDWLVNLYDPEIGGFYYSNSARDTDGFGPDTESTCQALGLIRDTGMTYLHGVLYRYSIPKDIMTHIGMYIKSLQREDGYFYNYQWTDEQYKGKKIIFSLGRLVPYKGYKYLIDSARYLDDDYMILIGGGGPLKAKLTAQIEERGLQDKVKLLGFVKDEDVAAYFGACDLFCMSSVYATEAFGIVQIEAMSAGKPVVATKIPGSGVSWVNAHKESGLNVEPKDSEALADAFMHILESEEDYNAFSEQAHHRYWTMFTKAKMIEKCIEIYKNL